MLIFGCGLGGVSPEEKEIGSLEAAEKELTEKFENKFGLQQAQWLEFKKSLESFKKQVSVKDLDELIKELENYVKGEKDQELSAGLTKLLDEVTQNIAVNDAEEYADFLKKLVEVLKNFKKQAELKNKKK